MTSGKDSFALLGAVVMALVAFAGLCVGAEGLGEEDLAAGETTEVRIEFPKAKPGDFTLGVGEGSVSVEIPAGSSYPTDFSSATGGLLRGSELTKISGDRIRLELRLAGGLFSGVDHRQGGVTLKFRRRIAAVASGNPTTGQYVLGPDDKIQIAVNGKEELTQQSVVNRNGTVSVPLVGEVAAAGHSVDEFGARLTELLARDYLVAPKVAIEILEYRSQWVMVSGEVKKAGRVPLRGATTVKEVLAEAEGMTSEAGETITVSRQSAAAGEAQTVTLDRGEFERGENNPPVHHGDIVTVEPAASCFVNGEVKNPGKVQVTRGLTLMRAISQAGGLTEWANRREVLLTRKDSTEPPVTVNLNKIEANPRLDPVLKGGELIMVKRRFL